MAIFLGITTALFVLTVLFYPIFGNVETFSRSARYWLTPDIVSMFRGRLMEDWIQEMRFGLWLTAGIFSGFGMYHFML